MKVPFVGPSETARSLNADAERTVNLYLEKNAAPDRPLALYGTHGLTLRATLASGANRGCVQLPSGVTYFVAGSHVYKIAADYTVSDCGAIGTSTGRVGIATNGTQVLIVDGVSGWIVVGTTLTEIADVDFPSGVTYATCHGTYFVVCGDGTGKGYWNETPLDGTVWNGLDFATAEGNPDPLVAAFSDGRVLWMVGTKTTEPWINTGDATQLFARDGNTTIDQGTVSAWTVAKMDSTIYWLSANEIGQGIVLRADGYAPRRVSDHALETAIASYGNVSDATAYTIQFGGHSWYVLTFPTADKTWVYDAATSLWFEWMWRKPADNTEHRHRSLCCAFNGTKHLVGDWENGKVYSLELDTYTDNGDTIIRIRRTQTARGGKGRLFFGEMDVEMETGVGNADCADPQAMLRYSNDDGHTWSNEKMRGLGAVGEYHKRVKFGPTGATKLGRGRVWELSVSDPVKVCIFGADVDVTEG